MLKPISNSAANKELETLTEEQYQVYESLPLKWSHREAFMMAKALTRKQFKTSPEDMEFITEFAHCLEMTMLNLYSRWLNEGKYEDIEDYRAVIVKALGKHADRLYIVAMSKKPFGFTFQMDSGFRYTLTMTITKYEWKRV